MFKRGRVRPSKGSSIVGMIVGVIFIFIGVSTFIPMAGLFGVLWTLMAVVITGSHVYNIFSEKGLSEYQVDVEVVDSYQKREESFDEKLRKLKALKDDGLINEEEYETKRKEILNDKW
jgi:uncharacterized membrane protein (DUF106 family)